MDSETRYCFSFTTLFCKSCFRISAAWWHRFCCFIAEVAAVAICVRHPFGGFGKLFASLGTIGWIDPISSFVLGRGCCNLCAAHVAYLSVIWGNFLLRLFLLVRSVQSAALFQVVAAAICVRHVSRTCPRFGETFCFACSYWLDWSNQQLSFRSRLLQFVCGTCREPVRDLGKLFASLVPIGWIDPISNFLSGRGCCNLCAARVVYLLAVSESWWAPMARSASALRRWNKPSY